MEFAKPKMIDIKKKINFSVVSADKTDDSQQPEQPAGAQQTPTASASSNPFITPMTDTQPGTYALHF